MLAKWIMVLLAITSLSPVGLVWAVKLRSSNTKAAYLLAICAVLASAITYGFFRWIVPKNSARHTRTIQKIESVDKDVLAFLLAYMLPLVTQKESSYDWYVITAVMIVLGAAIWQAQLIHVNPLLGLLGFHFHKVSTQAGNSILLISRGSTPRMGEVVIYELSEVLWYVHQAPISRPTD